MLVINKPFTIFAQLNSSTDHNKHDIFHIFSKLTSTSSTVHKNVRTNFRLINNLTRLHILKINFRCNTLDRPHFLRTNFSLINKLDRPQYILRTNLELVQILKIFNGANDFEGVTQPDHRLLKVRYQVEWNYFWKTTDKNEGKFAD